MAGEIAFFVYSESAHRVLGQLVENLGSGRADSLEGYTQERIGEGLEYRVVFAKQGESLKGAVFLLTESDLELVDKQQRFSGYTRREVTLQSGKTAWAYLPSE